MILTEHEKLFDHSLVHPMTARSLGNGIDPAGGRAVFINPTPLRRNERTAPALVLEHLEINHGEVVLII